MKWTRMRSRGFTLVEVMVATTLATVVLGATYQLFSFGVHAARRSELITSATDSVGSALVQIARRIRYVDSVDTPAPGESREVLEYSDLKTGAWSMALEEDELVLREKLGLERRVLARGLHGIRFERDRALPEMIYLTVAVKEARGVLRYRSAIYIRGDRTRKP